MPSATEPNSTPIRFRQRSTRVPRRAERYTSRRASTERHRFESATNHAPRRCRGDASFVRDYEAFPTVESRWEGWNQFGFHPCLLVRDARNVEITGRGTIDGQGDYWWSFYDTPESEYPDGLRTRLAEFDERNDKKDDVSSFTLRPPLFQVTESENVSVSGVTLRNSPFWNTHIVYSENVTVHDVNIENPADAPNGDGIDIDSSRHVRISDTYVNAGDDAICIKSGKDEEGRTVGEPASQITITNCTVKAGHGGVVIGSEMSGDVRDVTVSNCTFTGTDRGIRIKTQRGRGGVVEDLRFDTIVMRRVVCPFVINGYYFTDIDSDPIAVDESTPMVRNVHFHNVTARDVSFAGFFAGIPERPFEGISFSNVRIDATRPLDATDISPAMAENYEATHTLFCKSLADVSFSDVEIRTAGVPAMEFEETDLVSIDDLRFRGEVPSTAVAVTDVGRFGISIVPLIPREQNVLRRTVLRRIHLPSRQSRPPLRPHRYRPVRHERHDRLAIT